MTYNNNKTTQNVQNAQKEDVTITIAIGARKQTVTLPLQVFSEKVEYDRKTGDKYTIKRAGFRADTRTFDSALFKGYSFSILIMDKLREQKTIEARV